MHKKIKRINQNITNINISNMFNKTICSYNFEIKNGKKVILDYCRSQSYPLPFCTHIYNPHMEYHRRKNFICMTLNGWILSEDGDEFNHQREYRRSFSNIENLDKGNNLSTDISWIINNRRQ